VCTSLASATHVAQMRVPASCRASHTTHSHASAVALHQQLQYTAALGPVPPLSLHGLRKELILPTALQCSRHPITCNCRQPCSPFSTDCSGMYRGQRQHLMHMHLCWYTITNEPPSWPKHHRGHNRAACRARSQTDVQQCDLTQHLPARGRRHGMQSISILGCNHPQYAAVPGRKECPIPSTLQAMRSSGV
jgi:hypothetical protein